MISLILPYWDRQAATDRAFEFLAKHYGPELEVVVVDDGSPVPYTYQLERHYPFRLTIVRLPGKNVPKNPCVPINRGVEAARGDIIVLSNPEILHERAVLGEMRDELEALGPNGYVLAAAWCPDENQWHCHSSIAGDRATGERQPKGSGFHFCAMLHRSLWERAGGFDEEYRDGAGYDDPDWVNRVHKAGGAFKIRDDLVVTHPKDGARTTWPEGAFERNRALFMRKWQSEERDLELRVVCLKWGSLYGPEYVNRLYAMVARNLQGGTPGQFICYTDNADGLDQAITVRPLDKDLQGWWGKLSLFKKGEFVEGERVVFFDLDTLIVGPIDNLMRYDGEFAMLRDCYRPDHLGSGVMMWRGGFGTDIWDEWDKAGRPRIEGGDQAWIERLYPKAERLQGIFPGRFASFKADCHPFPPPTATVVYFHGFPKPHETDRKWVSAIWTEGDGGGFSLALERNVHLDLIAGNEASSVKRGLTRLVSQLAHSGHVAIVGGGPSLRDEIHSIKLRYDNGQTVWALNGTLDYLLGQEIKPHAFVLLDARASNARFIQKVPRETLCYVASQCHPSVYDALADHRVIRFDLASLGNCGTTVGTHAMALAYVEGFRAIHLYGFDSSYRDGEGHAYAQSLNDGERTLEVWTGDKAFRAAPWMAQQAQDLQSLSRDLIAFGCEITVHGDGLWPEIARLMTSPSEVPERVW